MTLSIRKTRSQCLIGDGRKAGDQHFALLALQEMCAQLRVHQRRPARSDNDSSPCLPALPPPREHESANGVYFSTTSGFDLDEPAESATLVSFTVKTRS